MPSASFLRGLVDAFKLTRILCSLSYPIIEIVAACLAGLLGQSASNDDDFPGFVDFHPGNTPRQR